jgi:hypothetical protein
MPVESLRQKYFGRLTTLIALTTILLWGSSNAPAYHPLRDQNGTQILWKAGSPISIYDAATSTVAWTFYTANFPRQTWPDVTETGAAIQGGFQTLMDVSGKNLNFRRLANTNVIPGADDGVVTIAFAEDESNDFFGSDITGALAVTYRESDVTGARRDADMFFNGDPQSSNPLFSNDGTPGTIDVQATATHECLHLAGAAHTPYYGARVFPFVFDPNEFYRDHCVMPDDIAFLRSAYPLVAPVNGTITGLVTLTAGGNADRAIVVATDANDIPQAIMATAADGTYGPLSVPPGTYRLNVFNALNSGYQATGTSEVNFTGSSPFLNDTPVTGVVVTAGNNTAAGTISATSPPGGATPGMQVRFQAVSPNSLGFQTLFLSSDQTDPSHVGTLEFLVELPTGAGNIAASSIQSVSLGSKITVTGAVTTAPAGADSTSVFVPYSVAADAVPGPRNLIIQRNDNGNERLFLPGMIKVVGQGGMTLAVSAGNPAASGRLAGDLEVPLLGLSFHAVATTASHTEDVRIRRLAFSLAGQGAALPALRLWIDAGTAGVGGGDTRIFSGAAYANVGIAETTTVTGWGSPPGSAIFNNLALTIPANTTVNLLLTADMPSPGTGTYTASFDPAGLDVNGAPNIVANGMSWGDSIVPTGATVTGGSQSTTPMTLTSPDQVKTTGGAQVPVGGSTNENQITVKGTVTTSMGGSVGMDVEYQLVGTAFSTTPTIPGVADQPSGTTFSVNITGLVLGAKYHWRARPVSSVTGPGSWVSFGGNSESAFDFSYDTSTTNPPTNLLQFEKDGTTPVPVGGLVKGRIIFAATNGTNSAAGQVRLEVEVQPEGVAFSNIPNVFSSFGPSGGATTARFSGRSGLYHWQARTANDLGTSSSWVNFDPTSPHFDYKGGGGGSGGGGCGATIPAGKSLGWGVIAVGLLLVALRGRRM